VPTLAVIAAGAMGSAIGARLVEHGARVLTSLDGRGAASRARAEAAGMVHADDAILAATDILISIVPPADAEALARRLAPALARAATKPVYIDANAVSPETVGRIAGIVAATGTPFLDGAILGLPPKPGTKGPRVYVSGDGTAAAHLLRDLGLDLRVCPGAVGAASSLKMSYAGLNKGLTALAAIMIRAAQRSDAGEALLAELAENEPALLARFAKALPDMAPKAYRWAPEMEEIAAFLGPDAAGRAVFDGCAALYRRLAAEDGAADIDALIRFAAAAGQR
jgi:3-hydroxyisobutyrate dehydrogenase-like beta-hydroxyacid dehydrogenase